MTLYIGIIVYQLQIFSKNSNVCLFFYIFQKSVWRITNHRGKMYFDLMIPTNHSALYDLLPLVSRTSQKERR